MSLLLVIVQLGSIVALLMTGPAIPGTVAGRVALGAGLLMGLWAVLTMVRLSRLRIMPEPAAGARLLTIGPYRLVRHPMYTAVLLTAAGLTLGRLTPARISLLVLLGMDLWLKLSREERFLRQRFADYDDYARRTKRLIPFVF